jgi:redox-sensitive bicupin YhaK (pirin superfamily)
MTAGAGVLHKEYHEKEFSKKGGIFQMVQLWVNLPSKHKMTPAKYQPIENKAMPKYSLKDNKSYVELIAGEYNGLRGAASTFSPLHLFNARLYKGALSGFSFSKKYNTGMLVIEGEIKINNSETVPENYFILYKHDGEDITIEAVKESMILVLSGEPIDEPVASQGPFVMNTETEIKQAYNDYYNGKFGFLED